LGVPGVAVAGVGPGGGSSTNRRIGFLMDEEAGLWLSDAFLFARPEQRVCSRFGKIFVRVSWTIEVVVRHDKVGKTMQLCASDRNHLRILIILSLVAM
jgi:hypothetical protein